MARQRAQRRKGTRQLLLELLLDGALLLLGKLGQERARLSTQHEVGVDGPQRAFQGEQGAREHRHRTRRLQTVALHHVEELRHRRRVEAARRDALAEEDPDVALQRPAVGEIVASGGLPGGAGHHDGVVQLEADRQLLQRLEHQRVEVPDRAEVEEPQHAVGDR